MAVFGGYQQWLVFLEQRVGIAIEQHCWNVCRHMFAQRDRLCVCVCVCGGHVRWDIHICLLGWLINEGVTAERYLSLTPSLPLHLLLLFTIYTMKHV